jgi:hypothetical protein
MPGDACGAKTRSGEPCKNAPMLNGRCRMHGGMTPRGPAHGAFKHGRHSKFLPARLADRYQEAMDDDALLELRSEIALLDVRISEVVQRIDTGESGRLWEELKDALRTFIAELTKRNADRMREPLQRMEHLIEHGTEDKVVWDELGRLLEQRRKLVESERKRMVEMHQMLTTEEAMTLLAAVVDSLRRHVVDRKVLAAVSADLTRLVAHTARDSAD